MQAKHYATSGKQMAGRYSRRHYEDAAKIIRDTYPNRWDYVEGAEGRCVHLGALGKWGEMLDRFTLMFAEDNSAFDADRFKTAATPKP